MKLDLHTHSTASDGQYRPREMVQKAKDAGLELYALTDHDTVDGQAEAMAAAAELGVHYVPGIEISTHDGEEIHMLGLFIDPTNEELRKSCQFFMEDRVGRGARIISFLQEKGIEITLDEVQAIAGDGSLGRPHFAQFLLEHGYIKTRQEAFDRYLNTPEFHQKTDRQKPSPVEAIGLIHRAGGKAVLAHPGLLKMGKRWQESLIAELAAAGLDGIECFYQKHTFMQTKYYKKLAKQYNLAATCGSDFHGEKVKPKVPFGMELEEQYRDWIITADHNWTIGKSVVEDIPIIESLFQEMLRTIYHCEEVESYEAGYLNKFYEGNGDWICVAKAGGQVVGYLSIEEHHEEEDFLYLDDMSVTASYRGQGIAHTFLGEAVKYAVEKGIPKIYLHVEAENTGAKRLYDSLGFVVHEEQGSRLKMVKSV